MQYSLNRLAEYILEKRIDYKQASLLLWLMQIASSNARNARLEPLLKEEIVRTHPDDRYFAHNLSPEELTAQIGAAFSTPPDDSEASADLDDSAASDRDSLSEGHGFSHADTKQRTRALAPEVDFEDSVIAVSREDAELISADYGQTSTPRKPPIEEVAPAPKRRRKA